MLPPPERSGCGGPQGTCGLVVNGAWQARVAGLQRVAFDTNALIYLFEGREPYAAMVAEAMDRIELGEAVGVLSTIIELELLVRPLREQNLSFVVRLDLFLRNERNIVLRPVDRPVARAAAAIRARTNLKVPDAILAATAAVERCDAIIGNDAEVARRSTEVPYLQLSSFVA